MSSRFDPLMEATMFGPVEQLPPGLPRCDREVGSRQRGWHVCGRRATVYSNREMFQKQDGYTEHYRLYFCAKHAKWAPKADLPSIRVTKVADLD